MKKGNIFEYEDPGPARVFDAKKTRQSSHTTVTSCTSDRHSLGMPITNSAFCADSDDACQMRLNHNWGGCGEFSDCGMKALETSDGRRVFESTRWSVVLLAGRSEYESRDALAELCEMYWYPIYSFVRSKHSEHHHAMDLTQGFFTHLLETNGLAAVDPDKGRFRSFLLASVKNYMANQWRKNNAVRRGGGVRQFSIDDAAFEQQYKRQLSMTGTPEELYERNWISTLLSRVVERLRDDYVRADKEALFNAIQPWLVTTADRLPQNDIAKQLDMSLGAVAMSIHRLRRRYAELVRDEVAHTVAEPEDVEDELARMLALLR